MKVNKIKSLVINTQARFSLAFATIGGYQVDPPTGLRSELSGPGALGSLVSRVFLFVLPIVGIIGFLFFLWSGFQFLMSRGEPKAIDAAKQRLTYSIVGLIIIFLAYSITRFVSSLFGVYIP